MLKGALKRFHSERGATMIEFALGAMIFFGLIFGAFDVCVSLWTKSQVVGESDNLARSLAIKTYPGIVSGVGCDALAESLEKHFEKEGLNEISFVKDRKYKFEINRLPEGRGYAIRALVDYKAAVTLIPGGLAMRTSSEAVIEDPNFVCF